MESRKKRTTAEIIRENPWMGRARAIALVVGALGTAGAAVYGSVRPEEELAARAAYSELSLQVKQLQAWAQSNQNQIKAAESACKAEVSSINSYLSGYLLALSRGPGKPSRSRRAASQEKEASAVVKSLIEDARVQKQEAVKLGVNIAQQMKQLPKLKEPPSLQNLQQKE